MRSNAHLTTGRAAETSNPSRVGSNVSWIQHGAPIHLPISDWRKCLRSILRATRTAGAWPSRWSGPITRLIQAMRWFSRRDGHPVMNFDALAASNDSRADANRLTRSTPAIRASSDHRAPGYDHRAAIMATTLASTGGDRSVCLMFCGPAGRLRTISWPSIIATRRTSCRFELFGAGRSWLGPSWQIDADQLPTSVPRPQSLGIAILSGTLAEWSYRAGEARITQSALLSGERSLALLSVVRRSIARRISQFPG